jgi:hypothetical protein
MQPAASIWARLSWAQVEGQITQVPRAIFKGSPVFEGMFSLPQIPGEHADGSDHAHPLKLESISATSFELFVRAAVSQRVLHQSRVLQASEDSPCFVQDLRRMSSSFQSYTMDTCDGAGKYVDDRRSSHQHCRKLGGKHEGPGPSRACSICTPVLHTWMDPSSDFGACKSQEAAVDYRDGMLGVCRRR